MYPVKVDLLRSFEDLDSIVVLNVAAEPPTSIKRPVYPIPEDIEEQHNIFFVPNKLF